MKLQRVASQILLIAWVFMAAYTVWYAVFFKGDFQYYFQALLAVFYRGGEPVAFTFWFSASTTIVLVGGAYFGRWLWRRF